MDTNNYPPEQQPVQQPQPIQPAAPTYVAPKPMSKRTKTALWLLIGPTALWVLIIVLYVVTNIVLASSAGTNSGFNNGASSFGSVDIVQTIINILTFFLTLVALISWLPGLIIGIVLLSTKPNTQNQQPPQPPQA